LENTHCTLVPPSNTLESNKKSPQILSFCLQRVLQWVRPTLVAPLRLYMPHQFCRLFPSRHSLHTPLSAHATFCTRHFLHTPLSAHATFCTRHFLHTPLDIPANSTLRRLANPTPRHFCISIPLTPDFFCKSNISDCNCYSLGVDST